MAGRATGCGGKVPVPRARLSRKKRSRRWRGARGDHAVRYLAEAAPEVPGRRLPIPAGSSVTCLAEGGGGRQERSDYRSFRFFVLSMPKRSAAAIGGGM